MSGDEFETAGRLLVQWYRGARRDLPWRRTTDPYAILVSEIMLQQTRTSTAVPYFERFLTRFPDVRALANADLLEVLKVWEGLGYYRRAEQLWRAAREIVTRFEGDIPESVNQLRSLPGVGEYTAAAVGSIAFGSPEPVLDGNASRVLARLACVREPILKRSARAKLRTLAVRLMANQRPGEFNQALMELGALVCTPRTPDCARCPLAHFCCARERGLQTELPVRPARRPVPHYDVAAAIIWRDGEILISQRKPGGMLAGLWEFPGGKVKKGETLEECVAREVWEELGVEIQVLDRFVTVKHAYSHFRITLHTFHCRWTRGEPKALGCQQFLWVRPEDLRQYPFPAASQKVIRQLLRINANQTQTG